jgi:Zn ribbon nucleic-acid-binding protein
VSAVPQALVLAMATCPQCLISEGLEVMVTGWQATGPAYVAGQAVKFNARMIASIECVRCGWVATGHIDGGYLVVDEVNVQSGQT